MLNYVFSLLSLKLYYKKTKITLYLTSLTYIPFDSHFLKKKKKSLIQPRGASCRAQFNTNRVSSRDETQITSVCRLFPPFNCSDPRKQCTARSPRFDSTFFHSDSPSPSLLSFTIRMSLFLPPFILHQRYQLCTRVFEYASIRNFVDTRRIQRTFAETKRKLDPLGA